MVNLKTNPQGLDAAIQEMQLLLNAHLIKKWGIAESSYKCYGKAYRNLKTDGYLPEVFIGGSAGNDYSDSFFNDHVPALSFFGLNNGRVTYNAADTQNTASVHLIFAVNMRELGYDSRNDEALHSDVQEFLEDYLPGVNIERITDIDRVYSDYSGWRFTNNMKLADMHPRHVFRFNFDLSFDTMYCPKPQINQPFN